MSLLQLSGLDAGFLALESPRAPMTVGGLSILDPSTAPGGLDVERFRTVLRERLHLAVAFRRRLAALPLDLGRPYWSELDLDSIDLTAHVERTDLPEPGGWRELSALMAWQLAQQLDRGRPLWHMTFVDGVRLPEHPRGTVALVATVHHAAIDGVSGAEILGALFDAAASTARGASIAAASAAANIAPAAAAADASPLGASPIGDAEPTAPPGALDLLTRAGRDLVATPVTATAVVGRSLLGLAAGAWSRLRSDETPPLPFSAPRSPLNRPLSGRLAWAPATIPLDRIKAIKAASACRQRRRAGDRRRRAARLARRARRAAAESLVAMVPVSVRAGDERTRPATWCRRCWCRSPPTSPIPRAAAAHPRCRARLQGGPPGGGRAHAARLRRAAALRARRPRAPALQPAPPRRSPPADLQRRGHQRARAAAAAHRRRRRRCSPTSARRRSTTAWADRHRHELRRHGELRRHRRPRGDERRGGIRRTAARCRRRARRRNELAAAALGP
jgi:hypothetical protein